MNPITSCCLLAFLFLLGCAEPDTSTVQSGVLKMKDAEIYYESHGKGQPLLLLHAGFLNVDMWRSQVPEFSQHYRVITIDLPSHGKTENDTVRLYPSSFLMALMDSLHLSKVSLAGVSLGATCVMDFLLTHPERVDKAILVSSGLIGWEKYFGPDTAINKFISSFFTSLEQKDSAAAAEGFTKFWFDGPYRSPQQVNDTARRYIYESTLFNIKKHLVRGWPTFEDTLAFEHIKNIRTPLLVIDGDKDQPLITKACTHIQQTVPGARRITISNVGHMLNMEAPGPFNKAVLEFLKQ